MKYGVSAQVWKFDEAPIELQNLSTNGGDEDWIVELPPGFEEYGLPHWVECMDSMGEPKSYPHPYIAKWTVVIGSHA
jgi:hypothetical protein